jgi:hypothetical protein
MISPLLANLTQISAAIKMEFFFCISDIEPGNTTNFKDKSKERHNILFVN